MLKRYSCILRRYIERHGNVRTDNKHYQLKSNNYISLIKMPSNTVHFLLDILLNIFTTIFLKSEATIRQKTVQTVLEQHVI